MRRRSFAIACAMAMSCTELFASLHWSNTDQTIDPRGTETVSVGYDFTNAGSSPVLIISAKGDCDCVIFEYPSEAIEPGAKGTLVARYQAKAQPGIKVLVLTVITESENRRTRSLLLLRLSHATEKTVDFRGARH